MPIPSLLVHVVYLLLRLYRAETIRDAAAVPGPHILPALLHHLLPAPTLVERVYLSSRFAARFSRQRHHRIQAEDSWRAALYRIRRRGRGTGTPSQRYRRYPQCYRHGSGAFRKGGSDIVVRCVGRGDDNRVLRQSDFGCCSRRRGSHLQTPPTSYAAYTNRRCGERRPYRLGSAARERPQQERQERRPAYSSQHIHRRYTHDRVASSPALWCRGDNLPFHTSRAAARSSTEQVHARSPQPRKPAHRQCHLRQRFEFQCG